MPKTEEHNEYRNKVVINQRGGSIEINNSTDRECLKLSHYSGSNIAFNNQVTSELATNNKQVKIVNDSFETVGSDKNVYVGKDSVQRVQENTYNIKGLTTEKQVESLNELKEFNRPIAKDFSQFLIQRGGESLPNGTSTPKSGSRADNPTLNQKINSVENKFSGYTTTPTRTFSVDQVVNYVPVVERVGDPSEERDVTVADDIEKAAGGEGSSAPGVLEFGGAKSGATENGIWAPNNTRTDANQQFVDTQEARNLIENQVGTGGDEIEVIKRHKVQTVGAIVNDYPSVRIDPKGRSQPIETLVGETGAFVNLDYIPHVEEIANDTNFPVGDYTLNVGNKYNVLVGSGGIQFKSSGVVEIGGASVHMTGHKVNIAGAAGVSIGSENNVEIQSLKSIQLRSNRQILVEPSLGVKDNVIVGGGVYAEGEVYVHHITAPVEIQETEDMELFGQFATDSPRQLLIAEALVGGAYWPVYALADRDLIVNYPHSHHFKNLPLRLTEANKDVRKFAHDESINVHGKKAIALPVIHARKAIEKSV